MGDIMKPGLKEQAGVPRPRARRSISGQGKGGTKDQGRTWHHSVSQRGGYLQALGGPGPHLRGCPTPGRLLAISDLTP